MNFTSLFLLYSQANFTDFFILIHPIFSMYFYFLILDNARSTRTTTSKYNGSSTTNLRNGTSKENLSGSSSSVSNRYFFFFIQFVSFFSLVIFVGIVKCVLYVFFKLFFSSISLLLFFLNRTK